MQSMKRVLVFLATASILATATASGVAEAQEGAPPPQRERVALLPASGTNVHEGYLQAAQDFLRAHLETTGTFQVFMVPGKVGANEVQPYEAAGRGKELGADLAVVLHIARLGNTARCRLAVYDTQTATLIHLDEMAAGSPDDLDKVLKRLAQGMATGRRAADSAEIDSVTDQEAEALLKMTATSLFGIKISAVTPVSRAGEGESAIPGAGVYWMYDARTFLAEVAFDFHYRSIEDGDSNHDYSFGLGAYYPFSRANTAPYAGLAVRYGRAAYTNGQEASGGTGVSLHLTGGLLIGRLSNVQLRGEASLFVNTFDETDEMGNTSRANGIVVSAGLGF